MSNKNKVVSRNDLSEKLFDEIMWKLRQSEEYEHGLSFQQIADWVSDQLPAGHTFTRAQVWAMKRDFWYGRIKNYFYSDEKDPTLAPQQIALPVFKQRMSIKDDRPITIINDVHLPFTDYDLTTEMLQHAESIGSKVCVIGGDLFNMGAVSKWKKIVRPTSLADEFRAGKMFMKELLEVFDRVYIIAGNHDRWFLNVEEGFDFRKLVGMITDGIEDGRVMVSPYTQVDIYTADDTVWKLVHQKEARKNYWSIADQIAQKYQQNIIITHVHKNLISRDSYDRYTIASIGGLHNPKYQEYIGLETTTQATQQQGYGVLYTEGNGRLVLHAKGF